MRKGYTFKTWTHPGTEGLPVIPYPIADVNTSSYYLDYAATDEILLEVGVSAHAKQKLRPTTFQLGMSPVAVGQNKKGLARRLLDAALDSAAPHELAV